MKRAQARFASTYIVRTAPFAPSRGPRCCRTRSSDAPRWLVLKFAADARSTPPIGLRLLHRGRRESRHRGPTSVRRAVRAPLRPMLAQHFGSPPAHRRRGQFFVARGIRLVVANEAVEPRRWAGIDQPHPIEPVRQRAAHAFNTRDVAVHDQSVGAASEMLRVRPPFQLERLGFVGSFAVGRSWIRVAAIGHTSRSLRCGTGNAVGQQPACRRGSVHMGAGASWPSIGLRRTRSNSLAPARATGGSTRPTVARVLSLAVAARFAACRRATSSCS